MAKSEKLRGREVDQELSQRENAEREVRRGEETAVGRIIGSSVFPLASETRDKPMSALRFRRVPRLLHEYCPGNFYCGFGNYPGSRLPDYSDQMSRFCPNFEFRNI